MENQNALAGSLFGLLPAYRASVLRRYQHFPNAFSALSVVHIIGSSFSAVVRLQSGPENGNRLATAQPGQQATIMESLLSENNFKNPKKPWTILCDKQQTRQRFLVAEERGR